MADNVIVRVPEQQFIRGEDGYSPEVTIENIDHGHSVNITDRDHPTGQSFNVMDGDSAYEQAVAGGYTGTEAQFNEELASFKSLSEETKDAAPFYAVYGQTTQAQIEAAINNKRQIYLLTAPLTESTPQAYVMPLTEKFEYQYTDGGRIVISRGYRFSITSGTNQYIAELANGWTVYTNDLTAPAQRAEAAAQQALIRMNSADASAQAAATTATTFTEQTVPAAVNTINEAKADALTAVGSAQTTAVGAVQQESTTQQAAIQQKGEDVLDSIPADYTELTEDVDNLKSAVGSNTFTLDEHILKPIKYATLSSNMTVTFDSPASQLNTDFMTGLIPLPVTLDGKITHNGFGYSNYRAIVFYDSSKSPIGSETHNGYDFIETTIPDGASFFRLNSRASASHILQASFNLSAAEKANYLRTLMHVEPDLYINDFDAPNIFTLERTEISTSTGEDTYSSGSNYSATDFILLPDDIELIGTYAYTAAGRARVAFYDAAKTFISAVYSTSKRLTATPIPEGAVFVRFGTHSTIPPASCIAVGLIKATKSNDEIIDMIRQALV